MFDFLDEIADSEFLYLFIRVHVSYVCNFTMHTYSVVTLEVNFVCKPVSCFDGLPLNTEKKSTQNKHNHNNTCKLSMNEKLYVPSITNISNVFVMEPFSLLTVHVYSPASSRVAFFISSIPGLGIVKLSSTKLIKINITCLCLSCTRLV